MRLSGWGPGDAAAPGASGDGSTGPYALGQHLGSTATLVLAALALSRRWNPFAVAAGLTAGFSTCWAVWASQQDSAFWAVSVFLVVETLGAFTVVSALLGYGLRPAPPLRP